MPFSSQPLRKKGTNPKPQDATQSQSCGHSDCKPAKVIDLPTEKKKLALVQEKISDKLHKDPKGLDKAAFVLHNWLKKSK